MSPANSSHSWKEIAPRDICTEKNNESSQESKSSNFEKCDDAEGMPQKTKKRVDRNNNKQSSLALRLSKRDIDLEAPPRNSLEKNMVKQAKERITKELEVFAEAFYGRDRND